MDNKKSKLNIKRTFFYLWPQIKEYKASFLFVFIGYALGIILDNLIKPYLYKDIIDKLSLNLPKEIIFHQSMKILLIIVIVVILHNVFYRIGDYSIAYMESKVMRRLYDFSFKKIMDHSYTFFASNFSGSIVAKVKRFVRSFEVLFDVISFQIFFSLVTLLGIILILLIKAPIIALVFFIWSIFYMAITILFIKKKIIYDSQKAEADSIVTGRLSDVILNILNIKIFSSNKKEEKSFIELTKDEEGKRTKAWFFGNFQNLIQSLMMAFLQILIIFIAIKMWYKGNLSIGMIVLLQLYLFNLFNILWGLGRSLTKAVESLTEMKEIIDIFDLTPDILDPQNKEKLKIKNGHILFKNVSFSYKDGADVLENFNLEIKPKEHIGIVGHSGSGKSTITKLLLRFIDIADGEIIIDEQNIKKLTQNDLRSVISYIPQDSILFHRTIKDNILYGNPNSTDDEIINVSKKANAHDFIIKLPKGYETLVGERGIKLSGGERQRISIARAMLKNSPILVLDEATSSLDSISEKYIQESFNELMKDKTTIVVAHRLSTIQKMDRIIVMDNGNVVEVGSHNELLNKKGYYFNLWSHQSGGFIN